MGQVFLAMFFLGTFSLATFFLITFFLVTFFLARRFRGRVRPPVKRRSRRPVFQPPVSTSPLRQPRQYATEKRRREWAGCSSSSIIATA